MLISAKTRIGEILKKKPEALEAIVSLSPKFEKLRNPILRKLMAGRTSIEAASRIGECSVQNFFEILQPFGFRTDAHQINDMIKEDKQVPAFLLQAGGNKIVKMDVRPVLEGGEDPLRQILDAVNQLSAGAVLCITNSFEPTPLILLLSKKGFSSYVDQEDDKLVHTYFYKENELAAIEDPSAQSVQQSADDWNEIVLGFTGKMKEVDVRHLEMPMPMMTILEALDRLQPGEALYVYHKKVPVFLLPELSERRFDFRIRPVAENVVHMIIFQAA